MGCKLGKIQIMVQYLACVIEHRASRSLTNNLLKGQILVLATRQELVQIVDVCLQMLAVVKRQRLRTNHRLEGIGRIG